ncbi:hypothetical protein GCM10023351_23540 [Microbacterium gilvum]|uniref:Holo-[acyl-carrier-protein] synthase n=1 Tax=Microbacterium gilvum TaxID=1336204 RepID=A0ABP9ABK9_9MICO
MIIGIGVDLVDVPRFERTLARTPRLAERLFTPHEAGLPLRSLAARYAAKEALIKALGGSDGVTWTEIEIARLGEREAPRFELTGATARVVAARGIARLHLSLSHDAGLAIAYVVAESDGDGPAGADRAAESDDPAESDGPAELDDTGATRGGRG